MQYSSPLLPHILPRKFISWTSRKTKMPNCIFFSSIKHSGDSHGGISTISYLSFQLRRNWSCLNSLFSWKFKLIIFYSTLLFQLICRFASLVCFQLPRAFFTMLLRTSRRAQFDILSRFLEIVLLKSTSLSPWMLLATLRLDVGDKLFEHVWETACTLFWGERTDSVELRALATC